MHGRSAIALLLLHLLLGMLHQLPEHSENRTLYGLALWIVPLRSSRLRKEQCRNSRT